MTLPKCFFSPQVLGGRKKHRTLTLEGRYIIGENPKMKKLTLAALPGAKSGLNKFNPDKKDKTKTIVKVRG